MSHIHYYGTNKATTHQNEKRQEINKENNMRNTNQDNGFFSPLHFYMNILPKPITVIQHPLTIMDRCNDGQMYGWLEVLLTLLAARRKDITKLIVHQAKGMTPYWISTLKS